MLLEPLQLFLHHLPLVGLAAASAEDQPIHKAARQVRAKDPRPREHGQARGDEERRAEHHDRDAQPEEREDHSGDEGNGEGADDEGGECEDGEEGEEGLEGQEGLPSGEKSAWCPWEGKRIESWEAYGEDRSLLCERAYSVIGLLPRIGRDDAVCLSTRRLDRALDVVHNGHCAGQVGCWR